ncbi:hypothetical protein EDD15DRAFT_2198075 [Pisolithus albus]|nr:hypothetical protein EDD15DRAFT_2198075 [Pisolithus albus]
MWKKQLRDYPWTPEEDWGPSDQELHSLAQVPHFMYVDGDAGERLDSIESEGEGEDDRVLDDELLYVVEEFALADEYHQQSDASMGEFSWGDEWDDDLLELDPPSSPTYKAVGEHPHCLQMCYWDIPITHQVGLMIKKDGGGWNHFQLWWYNWLFVFMSTRSLHSVSMASTNVV